MSTIPYHLTISQILSLANTKDAPWIKKRRTLSNKRILYSVRSDFLVYYTDIWYRNRNPDTDRVFEIIKSIEQEGEPDNRVYLAWIKGGYGNSKLMCFDGNHRREALIRLYRMKGFTCWIDLDILMEVDDIDVVKAFRRINMGVSVPDVYIEDMENEVDRPVEESTVYTCEQFVESFKKRWKYVLVDKNKTRSPYCTKNDLVDIVSPYLKKYSPSEIVLWFDTIHKEHQYNAMNSGTITATSRLCKFPLECYIFYNGVKQVKKRLEQLSMS